MAPKPYEREWDLRLLGMIGLSLVLTILIPGWRSSFILIPHWSSSFNRIRYWNIWLVLVLIGLAILTAYFAPRLFRKNLSPLLNRWLRVAGAIVLVLLLGLNVIRANDLAAKTDWYNRHTEALTGVSLSVLEKPYPSSDACKQHQEACKSINEYRLAVSKAVNADLDRDVANMSPAQVKSDNAQPPQKPGPGGPTGPGGPKQQSGVICSSSKFGPCAIAGILAIGCMALTDGAAIPECLAGAMAIYEILGGDKSSDKLAPASTQRVGAALTNVVARSNESPSEALAPLADEDDPEAARVTARAIEGLAQKKIITDDRKNSLLAELQNHETRIQQSVLVACQSELTTIASGTPSDVDWCKVSAGLQRGHCLRASLSKDQATSILNSVVNNLPDEASKAAARAKLLTCPVN